MRAKLPEKIDPKRLAHHGARLDGELPAVALARLRGAYDVKSPATVALEFSWSAAQRPVVRGDITVRLGCTCQRCLRTFETTVRATVDHEIGEAPRDAEQDFELLLGPDEVLDLTGFVEDELLLEAPMIPVHPAAECGTPAGDDAVDAAQDTRRKPFAGLQEMMDRTKG